VYYPLAVEPYTPAHHFERGRTDPDFRTKLKIAQELVEHSVASGVPFRAVVADSFYGEDEDLKGELEGLGVGYVMALKESHCWWHLEGQIGALWEAAEAAGWENADEPGGGEESYAPSGTATGRVGGSWRSRRDRTAPRGRVGRSWSPPIPRGCRAWAPGI
jgi:SRSO17 transposase